MATPAQEASYSNLSRPCFQGAVRGGIVAVLGAFIFLSCHVISCDEGIEIGFFVFHKSSDFYVREVVSACTFPDRESLF